MKKIQKLKLTNLSKEEMIKREMNSLRGGCLCGTGCGCRYEGEQCSSGDSYYGGSSTADNNFANNSYASERTSTW